MFSGVGAASLDVGFGPWMDPMSRLHLSSKSLPGVLEDVEVPDAPGDGLRWKRTS